MGRARLLAVLGVVLSVFIATSNVFSATPAYTLRLGHAQPTTDIFHLAAEKFASAVEARTDGKVKVQIFPSSQLGPIPDMIEGLRNGTVHVVVDNPSRLDVYTPLGTLFALPFMIDTKAHGEKVWSSPLGKRLFADIAAQSSIELVALGWRGARVMTSNRAIHTLDDLKGLKMRVPSTDVYIKTWQALGTNPTPMDPSELYLALQQKAVDAQENSMAVNYSSKYYEVCKYVIMTGHIKEFGAFMMGKAYLDKLPSDIKAAIYAAAQEASKYQGDLAVANENDYIKKFKESGVTFITPDINAFKARLAPFVKDKYPALLTYYEEIKKMQ